VEASTNNPPLSTFKPKSEFLQTIMERGFFHQCTDLEGLDEALSQGEPVTAYLGFDATASSLHVGSLLQIMLLRHFQKCGHKPLVLVGGGTTKVGDPSGKDESRQMLNVATIQSNIAGISSVFAKFLAFEGSSEEEEKVDDDSGMTSSSSSSKSGRNNNLAKLVDNNDWLEKLNYLEFLRVYGPHFTIKRMLSYESVKQRLEREQPLTFLEFNYMILQAYDFLELNRREKCVLQFWGSDQWGNIVNGLDLTRKVERQNVFGLTAPLITTADGKKMGKSASGAVWLNDDLLKPYDYWQFWRNTDDADVEKFLKLFTELDLAEVEKLVAVSGAALNDAKVVLADECTALLHGRQVLSGIKETAAGLFAAAANAAGGDGGMNTKNLPRLVLFAEELRGATSILPGGVQVPGKALVDVLIALELATSKADARRLIKGGGARVAGEKVVDENYVLLTELVPGTEVVVSAGKKRHGVVEVSAS
jgi:tyrosyl-tRNA synthetase